MVRLIKQTNVFPLKKTLKKFIIWGISRGKGTLKEGFQASSKVLIINKDSGDHTLAINSTKTRVDLPTGHFNKDQIFFQRTTKLEETLA